MSERPRRGLRFGTTLLVTMLLAGGPLATGSVSAASGRTPTVGSISAGSGVYVDSRTDGSRGPEDRRPKRIKSVTADARDCATLTGRSFRTDDGDARVLSAAVVTTTDTARPLCQAAVVIDDRIRVDVQAPLTWNRRYVQLGGGGFCGSAPTLSGSGADLVAARSAIASSDSGHVGTPFDATWASDSLPGSAQAETDWGNLSEHLTSQAATSVLRGLFRKKTAYSYFIGCSTGGRQALVEAQRYPDDFDGIVAGAPANRQNYLAPLSQGWREVVNHRADRSLIVDLAATDVVRQGVLDACDALDGVVDAVVDDPRTCAFDPGDLACTDDRLSGCLTSEQVTVLRKWYGDPRDSRGSSLYPGGLPLGSEGGWPVSDVPPAGQTLSGGGIYAENVLKFLAFPQDPPATYSLFDFDFDEDPPLLDARARAYNADEPDMSAFRAAGGKLLMHHGLADPLITPMATIQYYEDGLSAMGGLKKVRSWYRMFLLPGVYHCSGGPGPDQVDWYAAIRAWVEKGEAPKRLVASKKDASLTRPLFPYPSKAAYSGAGSTDDQASFVRERGPRGRAVQVVTAH
ncbi:Tannase and feruloyl esterase [Nocardioides dokdonensis FR1436]|uniref:Tannase and feruloyl esterase n=1 Tax=Nocardioides dokdonensis FR1436 TaxID=1300347 RepID=A0A1A9GQ95_9ACTN|nr:tannase/feruloyl esterase family alpha/beta hydrolase [Nocardioides dokdonensis]ANH39615.1 Tannase and feruloyl esterase [Nocardioides dokdonensis FR1436]